MRRGFWDPLCTFGAGKAMWLNFVHKLIMSCPCIQVMNLPLKWMWH